MIKQYLYAILGILWLLSLGGTAIGAWKVHSWKDGSDAKTEYQQALNDVGTKLTALHTDEVASQSDSLALAAKVDNMQRSVQKTQEDFSHVKLAAQAAPNCPNPFTLDFVRDLNSLPGTSGP